jgi:hypothetical protein
MCLVHIWLGAGMGKDKSRPLEPFSAEFWKRLFRMSFLLAIVVTGLQRCFPTAHGSLHYTVFKCQYQEWNPNVHLVDHDNQEPMIRVLGGLLGMALAFAYNKILIATRDSKDDDGYYFRLVWGREPPPPAQADDTKWDEGAPYARRYATAPPLPAKRFGKDYHSSSREDCDFHTVCVTRSTCRKHPDGVGCNSECRQAEAGGGKGFKLRIPYAMDHPK